MRALEEQRQAREILTDNPFFTLSRIGVPGVQSGASLLLETHGGAARPGSPSDHDTVPALSRVLDVDAQTGTLVLEAFSGTSLETILQRQSLAGDSSLGILRGVAAALDAMHRQGHIHGMLGPWSVLVDSEARVRFVDWAVAFATPTEAQRRALQAFAAPEWLLGEEITAASDQFSFGVLALRLIDGERAFRLGTAAESLLGRMTGVWRPAEAPTTPGAAAFDRVFAADPARRFAHCGEFVQALERQLTAAAKPEEPRRTDPSPAPEPLPAAPPPEPPSRAPVFALRATAICAIAAFALGASTWQSQRTLASVSAQVASSAAASSNALLENGRMKVCNPSAHVVTIRRLAAAYWNSSGHLETFSTGDGTGQTWTVSPDSQQNLSWAPAAGSDRAVELTDHSGPWDGSVLFYFLDIEQAGKQYILSGRWSAGKQGCLTIAPGAES